LKGVVAKQIIYHSPRSLERPLSIALTVTEAGKQQKFNETFYAKFIEAVTVSPRSPSRQGSEKYSAKRTANARPHRSAQRYNKSRNTEKPVTSTGVRVDQSEAEVRCYNCDGKGYYARVCPTRLRRIRTQNSPEKENPSGRSNHPCFSGSNVSITN
jgi:hypothetical protein